MLCSYEIVRHGKRSFANDRRQAKSDLQKMFENYQQ